MTVTIEATVIPSISPNCGSDNSYSLAGSDDTTSYFVFTKFCRRRNKMRPLLSLLMHLFQASF